MAAPIYTNFGNNSNHLNQATSAFNEVRLLLGKANSRLVDAPHNKSEQERFEIWFGQYTEANRQVVYTRIHNMLKELRDKRVTINHGGADCEQGDYAYVEHVGGGLNPGVTIFLCQQFFVAPLYGENSQVGTILHEVSHLVGGTDDHRYGPQDCKELARNNPALARQNADNYEYYIESFHYNT